MAKEDAELYCSRLRWLDHRCDGAARYKVKRRNSEGMLCKACYEILVADKIMNRMDIRDGFLLEIVDLESGKAIDLDLLKPQKGEFGSSD